MIAIDWQQVIGSILIGGSGLGGAIWAAIAGRKKFCNGKPATTERKADEQPPEGAVKWVQDIVTAMGKASPESVVLALLTGYTRAEAQEMRIAELESGAKQKMTVVPMDLKPRVVQEDTP
jgi:hypothetical protein